MRLRFLKSISPFSSFAINCFSPCFSTASISLSPLSLIVFINFSKAFPSCGQLIVACCITLLGPEGNISSPVRYSYLPILPDDRADILAAFL